MAKWAEESPEEQRAWELMTATSAYVNADGSARYWGFNGGGAASDRSKNYLRSLLRRHAGHTDAEAIRALFNGFRTQGERICRQDVSAAIEALKNLS